MARVLDPGSFFGGVRRRRVVADLTLAETEYTPGFSVPAHSHPHPFFCLAVAGTFRETLEGQKRVFHPTEIFYYPAGATHSEMFDSRGGRVFNIQPAGAWFERIAALDVALPADFVAAADDRATWLAARLYREFREQDDVSSLSIDGYLLAILEEFARATRPALRGRPPAWLARAVDSLHACGAEPIGLAELAAGAGVHPTHVARWFRRVYGCTAGEYARRLRLERARRALADARRPIAAVAADAGFADQSHLTRTFRQATGMTPLQYRRALGAV